jgi:RNA polymerase sigma factor (sigma-70 family)
MANRQAGVLRHIRQLYSLGALGGTTDARLLAQFLDGRDAGAEVAFEVLVERHGPMVFDVCRRVLRDEHAAEDAFQATFLVLARKAGSLWVKDSLGSWLHGVAHRVASRARSDAIRRRQHERQAVDRSGAAAIDDAMPDMFRSDAEVVLSEEVARLPEKYRAPTVLCYLESMSYEAAASRLGLTESTVRGRLARARERLRSRLTRRGVEFSSVFVGTRPVIRTARCLRPELLQSTIQAVMSRSAPWVLDSWPISATAVSLSERVCRTMIRTKLSVAALTLALGAITAGALVSAQSAGGRQNEPERAAPQQDHLAKGSGWTDLLSPNGGTEAGGPHHLAAATGSGGNLIVDWTPVSPNADKVEIKVDAVRHCVHLPAVSVKRGSRPNDGAVRLDLERGTTYQVAVDGEAFMGPATGPNADPFPGVVLVYGTDGEDGYAIRQSVVAPGKSITFKTPWAISPEDEVFVMAFFLDIEGLSNRGGYTLTVTEAGERNASRLFRGAKNINRFERSPEATRFFRGGGNKNLFERSPEPTQGGGSEASSQQGQGSQSQSSDEKGKGSYSQGNQQSTAESGSSPSAKPQGNPSDSSGNKQGDKSSAQGGGSAGKSSQSDSEKRGSSSSDWGSQGKSSGQGAGQESQDGAKNSGKSGENGAGSQGGHQKRGGLSAIRESQSEKILKQAEYYNRVNKAATAEFYLGKLKRTKPKPPESTKDESKP